MRRRHALGLLAGAGVLTARHAHVGVAQMLNNIRMRAPYQVTVGTSAAALTSSGDVAGVKVMVISDGHEVWFGTDSTVSPTTGWPLADRDWDFYEVRNANELYVVCPTSPSARVVVWPFVPY